MPTAFSWGYWGWGNSTRDFVRIVDAVEKSRGYRPPMFVDVRLRRAVRAEGFKGDAFGAMVGRSRYRWMPDLGNLSILKKSATGIRIKRPAAAEELLDLIQERASRKQRIIFFCACDLPCDCHRRAVGSLLLSAARRRKRALEVVEWPGGEPQKVTLKVTPKELQKVQRGGSYVPLGKGLPLAKFAGLPIGSIAHVVGGESSLEVAVAPACEEAGFWFLPILATEDGENVTTRDEARHWRRECGYMPRKA